VQHDFTQFISEVGTTRFAREDDLSPLGGEPFTDKCRLRAFARSVASLERDEQSGHFFARVTRRIGVFFVAGPFARRSAMSSTARSCETSSGTSPAGIVAFVSPSVTYGPNLPLSTLMGFPLTGSGSSSLMLDAERDPYLGCANNEGLLKRHVKDGLFVFERTRFGPLLEVWAVRSGLRRDGLLGFRVSSHDARKLEQPNTGFEVDRGRVHRREQRRGARLRVFTFDLARRVFGNV